VSCEYERTNLVSAVFTARPHYDRFCLSVCLSVIPSVSGVLSRRMKIRSCGFQHLVGQYSEEVKSIWIFAGHHAKRGALK